MRVSLRRVLSVSVLAALCSSFAAEGGRFQVFKSVDRGRSWSLASNGLPAQSRVNAFGAVAETLLAGTDAGVYVSTNEALTWAPSGSVAMNTGRILAFGTMGDRVYAGTDGNGLWVSADNGQSWSAEGGIRSGKVRCLLTESNRLYAGTDRDGVYVGGLDPSSWVPLRAGLPEAAQVFALAAAGGRVYAALYHRGLHVWEEGARRWKRVGTVTPLALAGVQGTLVAGHNPGGLYGSADGGVTWFRGTSGVGGEDGNSAAGWLPIDGPFDEAPVWELGADGELAFAGVANGTYYSEDRGQTWVRAEHGLPEGRPGVAFLVTREFVLVGVDQGL